MELWCPIAGELFAAARPFVQVFTYNAAFETR